MDIQMNDILKDEQAAVEQADFEQAEGGWELTSNKCPNVDCGGTLERQFRANGPDDYVTVDRCTECKEEWEG